MFGAVKKVDGGAAAAERALQEEQQRGGGGAAAAPTTRDAWMTDPSLARRRAVQEEAPDVAAGPPSTSAPVRPSIDADARPAGLSGVGGAPVAAPAPTRPVIGDGGASWRLKALQRAQAEAAGGGGSVAEIVADRWGSLAALTSDITAAAPASARAHLAAARDRARALGVEDRLADRRAAGGGGGDPGGRAPYLAPDRGPAMRRPGGGGGGRGSGGGLSWRRDGGGRGRDHDRRRSRSRSRSPAGRPHRHHHHHHHHRQSLSRSRSRSRSRSPRRHHSHSHSHHHRHHHRRSPQLADAAAEAAAAIAAVAPAMNAHANDGRFMARFKAQERAAAARVDEVPMEEEAEPAPAPAPPAAPPAAQPQPPQPPPPPPPPPAGKPKANAAAAAALRARLTGRPVAAPAAAPAVAAAPVQPPLPEPSSTVHLPLVDAAGRATAGAFGRDAATAATAPAAAAAHTSRRVTQRYGGDGARARHFADDDDEGKTVAALARAAAHGDDGAGGAAIDAALLRAAAKSRAGAYGDADAEYDDDAGLAALDSAAADARRDARRARKTVGRLPSTAADRQRAAAIAAHNAEAAALASCGRCLGGAKQALIAAASPRAYLAVPAAGRLVPGHCVIVPVEHAPSERAVDEATANDMRNFKKCVLAMHARAGAGGTVFVETALDVGAGTAPRAAAAAHAVVHAVPLPRSAYARAPAVFRSAIDEAGSEWATHRAKRWIPTGGGRASLRGGAIPPGFPYMAVEFGLASGFVHPVDDVRAFREADLGRAVLVGLLGLPPETAHRRAKAEAPGTQAAWGDELRAAFGPHDWTRMLGDE